MRNDVPSNPAQREPEPVDSQKKHLEQQHRDVLLAAARKLCLGVTSKSKKPEIVKRLLDANQTLSELEGLLTDCEEQMRRKRLSDDQRKLSEIEHQKSAWRRFASRAKKIETPILGEKPTLLARFTAYGTLAMAIAMLMGYRGSLSYLSPKYWLTNFKVQGRLVDGFGQPMSNVRVCFVSDMADDAVTDEEGLFTLANPTGPIRTSQTLMVLSPADIVCLAPDAGRVKLSADPNHVHQFRVHRPGSGTLNSQEERRAVALWVDKSKRFSFRFGSASEDDTNTLLARAKEGLQTAAAASRSGQRTPVETFDLILSEGIDAPQDARMQLLSNWLVSQRESHDEEVAGLVHFVIGEMSVAKDLWRRSADENLRRSIQAISDVAGIAFGEGDYRAAVAQYKLVLEQGKLANQSLADQAKERLALAVSMHLLAREETERDVKHYGDLLNEEVQVLRPLLAVNSLSADLLATSHLTCGLIQQDYGEFDAAIESFTQCHSLLEADPGIRVRGWIHLADCFRATGKNQAAIAAIKDGALKIESAKPTARAQSLRGLAVLYAVNEQYDDAIRTAKMALHENMLPREIKQWVRATLGELFVLSGRSDEAQPLLATMISDRNCHPMAGAAARLTLARLESKNGDYADARAKIRDVISLKGITKDAVCFAHITLGQSYLDEGLKEASLTPFRDAVETPGTSSHTFAIACYRYGLSLANTGHQTEAQQALTKAIASKQLDLPTRSSAYFARSTTRHSGSNSEKVTDLRESLRLAMEASHHPLQAATSFNLGVFAYFDKNLSQAIDYFEAVKVLQSDQPEMQIAALIYESACYQALGQKNIALDRVRSACGLADSTSDLAAMLHWRCAGLLTEEDRRRELVIAVNTCPVNSQVKQYLLLALGEACITCGSDLQAADCFRQAEEIPDGIQDLRAIACLQLCKLHDSPAARRSDHQRFLQQASKPGVSDSISMLAACTKGEEEMNAGDLDAARQSFAQALSIGKTIRSDSDATSLPVHFTFKPLNRWFGKQIRWDQQNASIFRLATLKSADLAMRAKEYGTACNLLESYLALENSQYAWQIGVVGGQHRVEVESKLAHAQFLAGNTPQSIRTVSTILGRSDLSRAKREQAEHVAISMIAQCVDPRVREACIASLSTNHDENHIRAAVALAEIAIMFRSRSSIQRAKLIELAAEETLPPPVSALAKLLSEDVLLPSESKGTPFAQSVAASSQNSPPTVALAHTVLAHHEHKYGNFREARSLITKILERPNMDERMKLRYFIARSHFSNLMGNHDDAISDYLEVVQHVSGPKGNVYQITPLRFSFSEPWQHQCDKIAVALMHQDVAQCLEIALSALHRRWIEQGAGNEHQIQKLVELLLPLTRSEEAPPKIRAIANASCCICRSHSQRYQDAVLHGREASRVGPSADRWSSLLSFHFALSLHMTGETREAISHYERLLETPSMTAFGKDVVRNNLCVLSLEHGGLEFKQDPLEMIAMIETLQNPNAPQFVSFLDTAARLHAQCGHLGQALNYSKMMLQSAAPAKANETLEKVFAYFDTPEKASLAAEWFRRQPIEPKYQPLRSAISIVGSGQAPPTNADSKTIDLLRSWGRI